MRAMTSAVLTAAAVGCLWLGGGYHEKLESERPRHRAPIPKSLEDAPPLMMFTTVVLGGFRGLMADILWLRVTQLQDSGDYFELVQLADWITKLEPDSAEVWAFHAWNLAYNVSVMMPDDEDRWRWVRSGLTLLRDEGILYNPTDADLYKELAWIFLHKIGKEADGAHEYYKKQWADEMRAVLGGAYANFEELANDPARMRRLRTEYRLQPEIMQELERKHGRLDWTRPEAHSLYWAYVGMQVGAGRSRDLCEVIARQSARILAEGAGGKAAGGSDSGKDAGREERGQREEQPRHEQGENR